MKDEALIKEGQGMNDIARASNFSGTADGGRLKDKSPLQEHFLKTRSFKRYQQMVEFVKKETGGRLTFTGRGSKFYNHIAKFAGTNAGNPAGGQQGALVDLPLSDVSLRYENKGMIAKQILTNNTVPKQSGLIAIYGQEHTESPDVDEVRVEGASAVSQLNTRSTGYIPYRVESFALMDSLSPSDRMNYMEPFMAEEDTVMTIKDVLMLICEKDMAGKLSGATVPSGRTDAIDFDNNGTANELITKKREIMNAMVRANGVGYNTMVMDRLVFNALRNHRDIIGNFFQTNISGQVNVTEAMVAEFFEIEPSRLLIADCYTTATKKRDAAKDRIWGTNIEFLQVSPSKARKITTAGFNHNYGTLQDYVLRRESYSNPMNEDFFVYSNWGFDIIDTLCLGRFTTQNIG